MHTVFKIEDALRNANKWLSVSELHDITRASPSRLRECLKMESSSLGTGYPGKFKSELIPGDKHGRRQWALSSSDTTGWKNASPTLISARTSSGRIRV